MYKLLIVCIALLGVAWMYREFFSSGFHFIAGDEGDSRFIIAILDHWLNVIRHGDELRSPPFFYPERHVLGYSESFLLFVPLYGFFRLFQFDSFLAYELVLISLTATSLVSVYLLLTRELRFPPFVSVISALVFSCSNMTYLAVGHGQLLSVAFVPIIIKVVFVCYRFVNRGSKYKGGALLGLAGGLLGLEFATCYYIAWSLCLLGSIFITSFLAVLLLFNWKRLGARIISGREWLLPIGMGAVGFGLGLIPFLYIYAPIYSRMGGRTFLEVLQYLPRLSDIVNVGSANLLWGGIVTMLCGAANERPAGHEMMFGWPLGEVLVVCVAGALSVRHLMWKRRDISMSDWMVDAAVVSGVVTWLVGLLLYTRFGEFSLWTWVYRYVPGADGLRVPQRMNMVSNGFVSLAVGYFLRWLLTLDSINVYFMRPRLKLVLIGAVGFLVFGEQRNNARTHWLDRPQNLAILRGVRNPPSRCVVFYVGSAAGGDRPWYANQIDGMLAAVRFRLPTVNGYSGVFPESWSLQNLNDKNYEARAITLALSGPTHDGVCSLDLRTGCWRLIDVQKRGRYLLGSIIDFRSGGNGAKFEGRGWWDPEEGGTWMVGKHAFLHLWLAEHTRKDLILDIEGHAFLPPQMPRHHVAVLVNGFQVAYAAIGDRSAKFRLVARISNEILRGQKYMEIEFKGTENLLSPGEYGLSADFRRIRLAFERARITLADEAEILTVP